MIYRQIRALACIATASAFSLHAPALPAAPIHAAASRPAVAAPQMNLVDRFSRLVKSNLNDLANKLEDPEKVLEQAVQDMQKDLVKVRQAYAEVSASTKRMEEQIKLAEAEGAKWYERAQLALTKGEEELAREALTRRKQQLEMADSLKEQVEGQQSSISSLYESMKELEAKMAEAKAKKDQIIARARTAKAATKVNDMISGVGTGNSMAAFERMSEKVEQLEAEADVSKQLAASTGTGAGTTIDQQFKALESGSQVDDELEAMKAGMKQLPSKVDDELEALKAQIDAEKKD